MPPAPSIEPVVASRRPQGSQGEPPGCRCSSCSSPPAQKHRGGFDLARRGPSVDYLKLARTCVSFAGITMQVEAVPEQALKGPRPAGSSGTRAGCCCLTTWRFALRWQRLPAFQKLGRMLTRHLDGLVNSCHETVPVGTVEAIHGNIRAMRRRDRGARDHDYLLLKVQKAPASRHPHHTA